jgi:hypothetical protein
LLYELLLDVVLLDLWELDWAFMLLRGRRLRFTVFWLVGVWFRRGLGVFLFFLGLLFFLLDFFVCRLKAE